MHKPSMNKKRHISIENKVCLKCGHDKVWKKPRGMFCTKCRAQVKKK